MVQAFAIVAFIVLISASNLTATEPLQVRIAYRNASTTDLVLLATLLDGKFLAAEKVLPDLMEFAEPQAVHLSLMTGRVDASLFISFESALLMAGKQPGRWRALAAVIERPDWPHYFLIAARHSIVRDMQDLVGKKIGYFPATPTMQKHLEELLKHHRIEGITAIPLQSSAVIPSLGQGLIDVVIAPEPTATLAQRTGVGRILNPDRGIFAEISGGMYPVLFAIAAPHTDPLVVEKLRSAYENAIRSVRSDPTRARISLANVPIRHRVFNPAFAATLRIPDYRTVREVGPADFQLAVRRLERFGILTSPPDLAEFFRTP